MKTSHRRWLLCGPWALSLACVHYGAAATNPGATAAETAPPPAQPPASPPPPAPTGAPPAYPGYADAVDALRRRCDRGALGGCVGLGLLYRHGEFVAQDEAQARQLFTKACNGGDQAGCALLGGNPSPEDRLKLVTETFRRECKAGNQQGCVALGLDYWEGQSVPKDRAKARELLRSACRSGDTGGCKVLEVLERAANTGAPSNGSITVVSSDPSGMTSVSSDPSHGVEVMHDVSSQFPGLLDGVVPVLEKSCHDGISQACVGLGVMYTHGRFVTRDLSKGEALLRKACDAGDKTGCTLLGNHGANR